MNHKKSIIVCVAIIALLIVGIIVARTSYVPKWTTNINDAFAINQGTCAINNAQLLTSFQWTNQTELLFRPFNDSTVVIYVHDGIIRNLGIVEVCMHLVQGNRAADYYLNNQGERITLGVNSDPIQVSIYLP